MARNFNVRNDEIVRKIQSELPRRERNDAIIQKLNERFVREHNDSYRIMEGVRERNDAWQNVMTGMGILGRDRKEQTAFADEIRLAETVCRNLYTYSGLAQTTVTLPVYDALRKQFTVAGDTDNKIRDKMKLLGADYQLFRARAWARCYGGAMIVMMINDGGKLTDELNWDNIKDIESIRVYHRYRTARQTFYLDPSKPNYWETETFFVNPPRGNGYAVHESRCLIFDGVDVAPEIRVGNVMWGDSVYQSIFQRLRGLGESYNNIEHIIGEFLLMITKIKGLASKIASGHEMEIIKRMQTVNLTRHLQNSYLLDADGEDATRSAASVSGLRELMEVMMMGYSADCRIPVRKLFGTPIAGAGLSNNGDAETRDYYDFVASSEQVQGIQPSLERLVKVIMCCKEGDFGGTEIDNWKIVWSPLLEEPMSVQLQNKSKQADIDGKYHNIEGDDGKVLSAAEIRRNRFGGGSYSHDTILEEDVHKPGAKGEGDLQTINKGE